MTCRCIARLAFLAGLTAASGRTIDAAMILADLARVVAGTAARPLNGAWS